MYIYIYKKMQKMSILFKSKDICSKISSSEFHTILNSVIFKFCLLWIKTKPGSIFIEKRD